MATPSRQFRWGIVGVLFAIVLAAWVIDSVRFEFEWRDVVQWLGVRNKERFTRLCILGVCLICIVIVIRVLRGDGKDERA